MFDNWNDVTISWHKHAYRQPYAHMQRDVGGVEKRSGRWRWGIKVKIVGTSPILMFFSISIGDFRLWKSSIYNSLACSLTDTRTQPPHIAGGGELEGKGNGRVGEGEGRGSEREGEVRWWVGREERAMGRVWDGMGWERMGGKGYRMERERGGLEEEWDVERDGERGRWEVMSGREKGEYRRLRQKSIVYHNP